MRFKVGDEVIVTGDTARTCHEVKSGEEATVVSVDNLTTANVIDVLVDDEDLSWTVHVDDLRLKINAHDKQTPQTDDPIRRQLWCDVFMRNYDFIPRMSHEQVGTMSDHAVEEYDKRFKL